MRIKALAAIVFITIVSCKSSTPSVGRSDIKEDYRDDFRSINENDKAIFLRDMKATSADRSVLLLTQGFKGEKIVIKQNSKTIKTSYPITNMSTKIASYLGFSNEADLMVFDNYSKKEIIVPFEKTKKYKFIYLMKEYKGSEVTYLITYSNTMRPLK